jgi:hypothetical protein
VEEIYHEGGEGAGRAGIEGVFSFLRVPWCPFVVNISVPGSFAYPVMYNQGTRGCLAWSAAGGVPAECGIVEEIYHEGEEGA